jgi:hypothetical protein
MRCLTFSSATTLLVTKKIISIDTNRETSSEQQRIVNSQRLVKLVQIVSFDRFVMKQAVRRHSLARWAGFYVIGWVFFGRASSSEDVVRVQGERF